MSAAGPAGAERAPAARGPGCLGEVFRFEVRYHLRQPLFWVVAFVFGLMTFGATTSDAVVVGGAIGNVHRNAPTVILQMLGVMSVLGIFVVTAFVASSVQRDFEYGTHELFFSKPVRKADYLYGRFAGSLLVSFLVFLGPALGIALGSRMPWLEAERLGPFQPGAYLWALFVLVLPNLLFAGALFFVLAAVARTPLATYLGVVGFLVLYFFAGTLMGEMQSLTLGAVLDPFGLAAVNLSSRYWTVVERNSLLPALAGPLLWNRLLWPAVGLAVLLAAHPLFVRTREGLPGLRRRRATAGPEATATELPAALAVPPVSRRFDAWTHLRQLLHAVRLETAGVLGSVTFLVLLAFGMFNVVASSGFLDVTYGTRIYPVTGLMLQHLEGTFNFLLLVIVTLYAGELVFRERGARLAEVTDAMPVPNWVPLLGKLAALAAVVVAFVAAGELTTVGVQLWRGYHHLEPGLYLAGLALAAAPFLLGAVLAVFLQVAANDKFLGYLLMVLFLVSLVVLPALHLEHRLYRFGSAPDAPYSDMNGWGHDLRAVGWFTLYWALFAVALLVLAHGLWVRGTSPGLRDRLALLRARLRGPAGATLGVALVAWAACGGWIYFNTNVLNRYLPGDVLTRLQAEYEKRYRQHLHQPLPRIVEVRTEVDLFPEERRAEVRGHYHMLNRTEGPLDALHLTLNPQVKVRDLVLRDGAGPVPALLERDDAELGYRVYRLPRPLPPGASLDLDFALSVLNPGFVNDGSDRQLVANGTFFNNRQYLPVVGYDDSRQLVDRNERRKHGLPPVLRMARIDDVTEHANSYLGRDSDWVRFETTVSTSADQLAIAPGHLEREWTENGRRHFHYRIDAPILHFYSYLSARYEVARDRWQGEGAPEGGVAIEVAHHPGHDRNVPRMIEAARKSLDYFSRNFSPYQHRLLRIVEFPRYATFAQSFPTTIPFSEAIGFIADLRDPDDIDYVFYVTAHEIAHQWWAHQVIGANVQGATVLSEALAQYSALMVMEKEYGREQMRKFLKYELDNYLRARGGELVEELPLLLVENQPYVHYRKGSLVMYAVREELGEEAVNRALAGIVREHAFRGAPFPTSRVLLAALRAEARPEQQDLLTDLFERITLFENRAEEATARRRPDGKWTVALTLKTRKVYADGQGRETEAPLDQEIEVGVFGPKPGEKGAAQPVLYLARHRLGSGETKLEVVVDSEPAEAGVDPFNKLVDRNSDDNRRQVGLIG